MRAPGASTAEPGVGYQRWLREDGDSCFEPRTDKDEGEVVVKWVEEAGAQPVLGADVLLVQMDVAGKASSVPSFP